MVRDPAGVPLSPAECPVCPKISLCSAAAGLRDHSSQRSLEPNSGSAMGGSCSKTSLRFGSEPPKCQHHPPSICLSLPMQGASSTRPQALPSCLPQVQMPDLGI